MPVHFTIDDGLSGSLHVHRDGDKIKFRTTEGGECWAGATDVEKLRRELAEMLTEIAVDNANG